MSVFLSGRKKGGIRSEADHFILVDGERSSHGLRSFAGFPLRRDE
jgi:hypothetical protein